jgi:hypothetical protein
MDAVCVVSLAVERSSTSKGEPSMYATKLDQGVAGIATDDSLSRVNDPHAWWPRERSFSAMVRSMPGLEAPFRAVATEVAR